MYTTIMSKNILYFLAIFCLFIQCDTKNEVSLSVKIEEYLNSKSMTMEGKEMIFILTDKGCIACNKSYSNYLTSLNDNKNIIIINLSDGSKIDIRELLNQKNVINDFNQDIANYLEIRNSKAIVINENAVDSVIDIKPSSLISNIEFLKLKMSS